eukprot:1160573-Pelagomonas_calceolata.AAC.11
METLKGDAPLVGAELNRCWNIVRTLVRSQEMSSQCSSRQCNLSLVKCANYTCCKSWARMGTYVHDAVGFPLGD